MTRQNTDYGYDIQKVYLEMFMTDAESFVRCQGVFDPQTFDRKLQEPAKFLKDYVEEHNALPTFDMINAATDVNLKDPGTLQENHYDWLLQEFETFSRHKALEKAILASAANMGVNWCEAGLNVLYLTFELSENLVSMRLDSMTTDIPSRDIFKSIDDVEMKVKMIGKKSGAFQVKYMPTGKNANDIRAYLKEYEIKTGRKVDVLLIDYLDLMHPIGQKISAENLFVKDKYVSEELRNLAMELNCIFVTASQLNRSSVEEIEFDHSHISGGISKINTADNLIGIFTSRAMRERGRYQIQLMKTRSSSGVGQKVDLEFDVDSLRIRDLGDEEEYKEFDKRKSTIYDQLKRTTGVSPTQSDEVKEDPTEGDTVGKIRAQTDSTKLRDFLNNLDQ